jgi:polyribonucleotide nucleotidyltransferase
MSLVAAVEGSPIPGRDFFPLTVDYREKTYAAGKFPGGFIKREGRPTMKETLTSRLIDRPIRPLFPPHYLNEVQVMAQVMSSDKEYDADILSIIGASAALHLSHIPFLEVTGAVRVGLIDGEFILMPTHSQLEESELDLVMAGTRNAVTMIEGFARELPEDRMLQALMFGHKHIVTSINLIEELRTKAGLEAKPAYPAAEVNPLNEIFMERFAAEFKERKQSGLKQERNEKVAELKSKIVAEFLPETDAKYKPSQVEGAWSLLQEKVIRKMILDGVRIDGRSNKQLRAISCEVGLLPRAHGTALFQRGETQALVIATLGTVSDEQRVDGLGDEYSKKFMLDYNFPPFSVGECRPIRGPGRREIGHGALAERSLKAVIPEPEDFPYTIRLVSEILESNGSSSMASVCGGTLALMDAGVPITNPVAGISIGLVKEGNSFVTLTDIMGDEDHYGDMDFKVAGTGRGITGIQLDLKINGINEEIMKATLEQAREARREILKTMLTTLRQPREEISDFAPRLLQIKINPEKIGLLIGPGGKTIKGIQEETGAKINVDDDGTVSISHMDAARAESAKMRVEALTEEVKIGKIYEGRVTSIKEFGAFIEILPGRDGLCHISELDDKYVERVDTICKVGDRMQVKVIAIDDQDRVKLSRKALMRDQKPGGGEEAPAQAPPQQRRSDAPPRRREGSQGDSGDGGRR